MAEEYFAWRRKLGFRPRTEREEVIHFARRIDARGQRRITLDTVVEWARDSNRGGHRYIAMRYEAVRRFLAKIAANRPGIDPLPTGYLGTRFVRAAVHIYTPEEVNQMMAAALTLTPVDGLRPHTIRTLLGLMDATGMRIEECLALDSDDVDFERGTIHIRRTKRGDSRLLPIHATTIDALREYGERRTKRYPVPRVPAFFMTESRNTRLAYPIFHNTFRLLRRTLGWHARQPRPRVHDLRHTFAVRNLLAWIRNGKDVDSEMPALSAYMGHATPRSTYWYFSAVPELGHLITGNMEALDDVRPGSPVV
jgi:integrase